MINEGNFRENMDSLINDPDSWSKEDYYNAFVELTERYLNEMLNALNYENAIMEKFGEEDGEYVIEEINARPEIQKLDMRLEDMTDKKEIIKTLSEYIECQFGAVIGSRNVLDEFPFFEDTGDEDDDGNDETSEGNSQ